MIKLIRWSIIKGRSFDILSVRNIAIKSVIIKLSGIIRIKIVNCNMKLNTFKNPVTY